MIILIVDWKIFTLMIKNIILYIYNKFTGQVQLCTWIHKYFFKKGLSINLMRVCLMGASLRPQY